MALTLRLVKGSPLDWQEMDDNLTFLRNNALITSSFTTSVTTGGIPAGTTISSSINLNTIINLLLSKTYDPTFVDVSYTHTMTGNALYYEIGSVINVPLVFSYNPGGIYGANTSPGVWDPITYQNPRGGGAISYSINGNSQVGNTRTVTNHTVTSGINNFPGTVTFATGVQPLDSGGNNYGSPRSGQTSPVTNASFEGVYPIFATTSSISSLSKLPLYSMINGNDIEITLHAETIASPTYKQTIEIPTSWITSRPLVGIYYFNTISGEYDTVDRTSDFVITSTTETVSGNTVNYKKYKNARALRGSVKIKLVF